MWHVVRSAMYGKRKRNDLANVHIIGKFIDDNMRISCFLNNNPILFLNELYFFQTANYMFSILI